MPEIGLVPCARHALRVATAALPRYRISFRKHQFTQPQLLSILCLMRYKDWTFGEAEVRLRELSELRRVLGLKKKPRITPPCAVFLFRLPEEVIGRALAEVARLHTWRRRRVRVAVDAAGLTSGPVGNFFVRRMHHHTKEPLPWRHWLKWLVVADLDKQLLLAQSARRMPWNDCAHLPTLVGSAHQVTLVGLVLADTEFDSERNYTYVRQRLKGQSIIQARREKRTWRIREARAQMCREFPNANMCGAPWSIACSVRPNASSHHELQGECCSRSGVKPCCSAWSSTFTG